jgi:hypothetical protein
MVSGSLTAKAARLGGEDIGTAVAARPVARAHVAAAAHLRHAHLGATHTRRLAAEACSLGSKHIGSTIAARPVTRAHFGSAAQGRRRRTHQCPIVILVGCTVSASAMRRRARTRAGAISAIRVRLAIVPAAVSITDCNAIGCRRRVVGVRHCASKTTAVSAHSRVATGPLNKPR